MSVIQAREGDLVIATFGRVIYTFSTTSRHSAYSSPETSNGQSPPFSPSKDALMYMEAFPWGGRGKGFQGDNFFLAENPPYGVNFSYYLKDKLKTKKEKRQEAEKEAAKKNQPIQYPTGHQLRAEADEEPPALFFTIIDADKESHCVASPLLTMLPGSTALLGIFVTPPQPSAMNINARRTTRTSLPTAHSDQWCCPASTANASEKVDGKISDLTHPLWFNVYAEGTNQNEAGRSSGTSAIPAEGLASLPRG